jgi:hypothetical protein
LYRRFVGLGNQIAGIANDYWGIFLMQSADRTPLLRAAFEAAMKP